MPRMLSDDQVRKIRAMYEETAMLPIGNPERKSLKDISTEFGISITSIHKIIVGETYRDVT